ncbi:MAG: hypothetical protein FWD61_01255 [Phycisphaerales bacterium]|nr:hypothetical protein [Phycisphaerales bacterium]
MVDLLQKGMAWLEDQRTKFMTQPVVYQRGGGGGEGGGTVEVPATIGTTVFQIDDGGGALLRIESRDYLILAADLMIGGTPIVPRRGDRIRETSGTGGGQVFVYEVVGPGDEPCWRWSDAYRQTLRIHTKQIDVENP